MNKCILTFISLFSGKAFEDQPKVVENHYEPIANIFPSRVTATATATASIIDSVGNYSPVPSTSASVLSPPTKPDLPPKPPGLLKMGEPGQPPRRVKALYNFKGSNNDEVFIDLHDFVYYWFVLWLFTKNCLIRLCRIKCRRDILRKTKVMFREFLRPKQDSWTRICKSSL